MIHTGAPAIAQPESATIPPGARLASMHALVSALEGALIPLGAAAAALASFALFLVVVGVEPIAVFAEMVRGAFGSWFSVQNTLQRAAPLMLAGLCTALPARLGLVVIGGEGALVLGGVAAASAALLLPTSGPTAVLIAMTIAGAAAGALWMGLVGVLRAKRGVNETISSLLLTYIAIALLNQLVEGPLRDPASLNKPSTPHIGEANMLAPLPGLDVHAGLLFGVLACVACYALMQHGVFGFAARVIGGNARTARLCGLAVPRYIVLTTALGGAAAGLAGMIEVAAVHGKANASLASGYGYTGILVAFLAAHNPLVILPVAVLLGGISASGGLLQRSFGLPDATVNVLQGFLFLTLLAAESFKGRIQLGSLRRRLGIEGAA